MLAMDTLLRQVAKCSGKLLLLTGVLALTGLAQADTGSSQTVMSLIVPAQAVDLAAKPAAPPSSPQPYYNHEATTRFTQQVDGSTRQVWITL